MLLEIVDIMVMYGRSIPSIADQLFGGNREMSDEDKIKKAQKIYDSIMTAFPGLKNLISYSQNFAKKHGYVETILGRRRHLPDMQLDEFAFSAMPGYVNPYVDPLDVNAKEDSSKLPQSVIDSLTEEFKSYKYYGQIARRIKELQSDKIKVTNNRPKIQDASRQCVNSRVQGSAADLTKMAVLMIEHNHRWKEIGGRILTPVHDELMCEVPERYYQEGEQILSSLMSKAGDFLPFPINCDVETTKRWYGMSFPCKYPKPKSLDNMSQDEIKWVQYYLLESEYILPVYKDENGDKPRGDAAKGCNGIYSEEMQACINDYIEHFHIEKELFLDHIEYTVSYGSLPNSKY